VERVDGFVPMSSEVQGDDESDRQNYVFARLAAGVSLRQARTEMVAIASRLEKRTGLVDPPGATQAVTRFSVRFFARSERGGGSSWQ
jgi:hypothetical protein